MSNQFSGYGRRAFSLIEVLASLVIFGIAIVGFIQSMASATRLQADLMNQQRALTLAQNVLEEMRYSGAFELGSETGEFEGDDASYLWNTMVEENEDLPELLNVSVTISWSAGVDDFYTLSTQIAASEMAEP